MKRVLWILITYILLGISSLTSYAASGWQQEGGAWKYYRGSEYQEGFTTVNGVKYYFNECGRMQTGWQEIEGHWYLFLEDGAMQTGWWQEGDTWYYFMLDGILLTEGYAPDGHWMDANGRWTEAVSEKYDYMMREEPYLLNWETDVNLASGGIWDMRVVFAFHGLYEVSALNEKEKAVYDIVKAFIDNQIKDTDTDYDKVVKITKFIWQKAESKLGYGNPYELLINGQAACSGYARTFKLMANAVGLECYLPTTPTHEWNIVRVEGDWYHADLTEPIGRGYKSSEAPYILRCDDEHFYSSKMDVPECTATKYTKSNID